MVDEKLIALLDERLDAVLVGYHQLERMVANVKAASEDGVKWVALDNLRRIPETIGRTHLALGRLNAVAELVEDQASDPRLEWTKKNA